MPVYTPSPVRFPLAWLLDSASPSLQYRAIIDIAQHSQDRERLAALPYCSRAALRLAISQEVEGTWNGAILRTPAPNDTSFGTVGTVPAYRRLLECGWSTDSPPLLRARRTLFRLLAEDNDPSVLFECAASAKGDPERIHRERTLLREGAAAALAQAGYESDPRLRGAARRMLDRVDTYLRSPLAAKPWVRVGNKQVLAAEATPPSLHLLVMLAYMPLFRIEHHAQVERIYQYVSQPLPRQEALQLVGGELVPQPQLILGSPLGTRNVVDADVPFALAWLEVTARLQFLRRNEAWLSAYDRFLNERDRTGVWRAHRGVEVQASTDPAVWPMFPLQDPESGGDPSPDVTFRLGLIARLLGRAIELV